jgi:two-component system, NarL family, response regulator LiaR
MGDGGQGAPVSVLIVDDHDLFRAGLTRMLDAEADIAVVAQASRGTMGVRLARELRPNVILMDLRMPDLDGIDATRQIVEENPSARVIALTVAAEERDVSAVVVAGACGYLLKDTPIAEVVAAVRAASTGESWLSPRAASGLLDRIRRDHVEPAADVEPLESLSPRELEVLRLVARGLENSQIAEELHISARTAKNHLSSVLTKLGMSNRVQAAIYAVRRGL